MPKDEKDSDITCEEGKDRDERILHVSGSNISLLELPEKELLAQPQLTWMSSLGSKELEFEVRSVAACGDTAVLAGDTQVAVIRFGRESPEVKNTFISHKSKILQTMLTRIRSKLYWLVGTGENVKMFRFDNDSILAPVTSFLTCDLVLFTMDTANERLFLLERSGIVWSAALLPQEGSVLPDDGVHPGEGPGALGQVSEGRYSSIFYSESLGQLFLVSQDSHKIFCGAVGKDGILIGITKVREGRRLEAFFCFNL